MKTILPRPEQKLIPLACDPLPVAEWLSSVAVVEVAFALFAGFPRRGDPYSRYSLRLENHKYYRLHASTGKPLSFKYNPAPYEIQCDNKIAKASRNVYTTFF
jgi:hypothetical protein